MVPRSFRIQTFQDHSIVLIVDEISSRMLNQCQVHVLEEFGMPSIEDWLFVCHPKTWPLPGRRMQLASSGCAALRQWVAEVNRLCHESKFGPVDWEEFQGRLRPMLLEMLGDAAVEY